MHPSPPQALGEQALVLDPRDNVATALCLIEAQAAVRPIGAADPAPVVVREPVALCHKFALRAIARKAIQRKTGARGLRSIMEGILLDTMFDLPGLEGVEQVVIGPEVVEGNARPLYIYGDREEQVPASA